jgi:UDP-N-acetylmuramate dehydrogenase
VTAPLWHSCFDISHLIAMATPAIAENYVALSTEAQLLEVIKGARQRSLPVHVLGGGSNVLCPPSISGLVIAPKILGVEIEISNDDILLRIGAGENWHNVVVWALSKNYFGLENLALIPGCAGAAPIQNIGAYGVEIASLLERVRWFDCDNHRFIEFNAEQCELGYRDSIFKHGLKGKAIITQIVLRLTRFQNPNIQYQPLADFFAQSGQDPTSQNLFNVVCKLRNSKLPDPHDIPNCGSFFKNPVITADSFAILLQRYPDIPSYPQNADYLKIPAAWLIEKVGLKGKNIAGLVVHHQQALVLTNPNRLPLSKVLTASATIIQQVRQQFGITLEMEPQILGSNLT